MVKPTKFSIEDFKKLTPEEVKANQLSLVTVEGVFKSITETRISGPYSFATLYIEDENHRLGVTVYGFTDRGTEQLEINPFREVNENTPITIIGIVRIFKDKVTIYLESCQLHG